MVSSDSSGAAEPIGELDRLRALRADRRDERAADVGGDRLVEVVAADAHRARQDDGAHGDDRHLAGAAADVDDHPPDRLADGDAGADGGGDRLLDELHAPGAGRQRRLLDRAPLDLGDARRRAHDEARVGAAAVEDLAHEVAQHLLGHLEVRDHAVAQRARGRDLRRRAPDHPLRVGADGDHVARALVDGHDRRLGEHDAAAVHVDDRVGGPQIDGHVARGPQHHQRQGCQARRRARAMPAPERASRGTPTATCARPA